MGLPTADDMVDCALLVSKLDCQARLLVRIQLSLIAISGSPGRGVKSLFLLPDARMSGRPSPGLSGRGQERGDEERGEGRRGEASVQDAY